MGTHVHVNIVEATLKPTAEFHAFPPEGIRLIDKKSQSKGRDRKQLSPQGVESTEVCFEDEWIVAMDKVHGQCK